MEMLPEAAMSPKRVSRTTYGGNRAFHNFANDYSHISDANLRRRLALSEIDKVPFGMYHIRAIAVAGVGFFLDSYDIFAISMVTSLLGIVFWGAAAESAESGSAAAGSAAAAYGYLANAGQLPDGVNQALKASTSAGIIVGMLLFGWLADVFGRRRMYGIELAIIVLSTLNCALASPSPSMTSTGLLVFWRVMMGVGIGGDYPLSSVITSEFAPTRWRGAMVAAVFSMQGIGKLLSAVVALVATEAFRSDFVVVADASGCGGSCRVAADRSWRIIIGFGALPACFALYYRITIPETPRYTFDVAHDIEKADADIRAYMASQPEGIVDPVVQARLKSAAGPSMLVPSASWPDAMQYFGRWKNLKILLGTTLSWFFLDLAYYGLALNNAVILKAIGYSTGPTLYHVLHNNAVGTIILACAGSLPGYWTAVFTIDTIGRKPLQVFGFLILTVVFCVLGFAFHRLSETSMLALYVVAQFFFNWGPNTTTFVVPGECFPTRYRSTGHGLSAAMGKLGAIVAQVFSVPILSRDSPPQCNTHSDSVACSPWLGRLMQIFALFMLCGTVVSLLLVPETKGITLEELAGEAPTSYNAGSNGSIIGVPAATATAAATAATAATGRFGRFGRFSRFSRLTWRPFAGGQPAGFHYPRIGGAGNGRPRNLFHLHHRYRHNNGSAYDEDRGDVPRIGIMTSPEIAARDAARPDASRGSSSSRWHISSRRQLLPGGHNRNRDTASTLGGSPMPQPALASSAGGSPKMSGDGEHSSDSGARAGGLSPPPAPPPAVMAARTGAGGAAVFPGWGAGWGRIDRGGYGTPLEDIWLQDVGSLLK